MNRGADFHEQTCEHIIGDFYCQGSGLSNPYPRKMVGEVAVMYENFMKALSIGDDDVDFASYLSSYNFINETTIFYIIGTDDWGLGVKILQTV